MKRQQQSDTKAESDYQNCWSEIDVFCWTKAAGKNELSWKISACMTKFRTPSANEQRRTDQNRFAADEKQAQQTAVAAAAAAATTETEDDEEN